MRTGKTLAECTANSFQAPCAQITVKRSLVAGSWKAIEEVISHKLRGESAHNSRLTASWPCPLNLNEGMGHLQI